MNHSMMVRVDFTNPGQFFGCCGLWELADRLWPGTRAWFDGANFHLEKEGNIGDLIQEFLQCEMTPIDPDDATSTPIRIGKPFRPLRLDWWKDTLAGGKELKVWAGTMESYRIAQAMRSSMRKKESFLTPLVFETSAIVYDPEDPSKKVEPFCFDSRRAPNAHARDIGFSPNDLGLKSTAFPAVELLCLVGLQRSRPRTTPIPRVFDYFTWSQPAPICLAPALTSGQMELGKSQGYRFENWYRTGQKKHKAFRPAQPMEKSLV